MRLTVGPLPASVYWRRRAVLLGAALFVVLVVSYTCSGPRSAATPKPTTSPTVQRTTGIVPADVLSPSATPAATGESSPTGTVQPTDDAVDPKACTDAELKVTARPTRTTISRGEDLLIYLLIKNESSRTCTRDIGPDLQELRVVQGVEKIWSSDDCDAPRGSNVQSFRPGLEVSFNVDWNGKLSTSCSTTAKRTPTGPTPDAGKYQVLGRVGTDLSPAVSLTIR
jgi:hypothetical protein